MSKNQHSRTFQITKKLNLVPDHNFSRPAVAGCRSSCGDKIESNLQSQMYVEQLPIRGVPLSSGVHKLAHFAGASTIRRAKFRQKVAGRHLPLTQTFIPLGWKRTASSTFGKAERLTAIPIWRFGEPPLPVLH